MCIYKYIYIYIYIYTYVQLERIFNKIWLIIGMFFFEYVVLTVSLIWCLQKCSTLEKECMYQCISVNKPHESQILAHKHFLVHFNLVTNVLFCLCISFLSLVVLRWLLLLFLSCGFFSNCTVVYVIYSNVC